MKRLKHLALSLCFGLTAWCAGASAVDTDYMLDLTVTREGATIGQPSIGVEAGKQAEVVIEDASKQADVRLLVTAKSSDAKSKTNDEIVMLDLSLFEKVSGEWVLRAEPTIGAVIGKEATVSVGPGTGGRGAPEYTIAVTASHSQVPADAKAKLTSQSSGIRLGILNNTASCAAFSVIHLLGASSAGAEEMSPAQPDSCCHQGNVTCCNATICCDRISHNCCLPP